MSWVYPPKVPLFGYIFQLEESDCEYLRWLSALAVQILRVGENVSKLVSIQKLEENSLGCQSLFHLFWKNISSRNTFLFGTGTWKKPHNTAGVTYLLLPLQNLFLNLADYLQPQILAYICSTSFGDSAATVTEPMLHADHALAVLAPWWCLVCFHPPKHLKAQVWSQSSNPPAREQGNVYQGEFCGSTVSHSCMDVTAVVAEKSRRAAFSASLALRYHARFQLMEQTLVASMAGFAGSLYWGWCMEGCAAGLERE